MERMKKKRGVVRAGVSKLLARMEEEANKEENEKDFLSDENKKEIINSVLMRETLINYFFKIFPLEKLCFS